MKKLVLVTLLLSVAVFGVFAEGPDYFSFTLGAGGAYNVATGAIESTQIYGVDYNFDDTFSGGFKFYDLGGVNYSVVNLAVSPLENAYISLYTGAELPAAAAPVVSFGAGLEYDFFTRNDSLFTAMGVYADWLASNGGAHDLAAGGIFTVGLKTKIGL